MCFDGRRPEAAALMRAAAEARGRGDAREASPAVPEDRGTPVWIWRDGDGWPSFERPRGAADRCEVSAPIGWGLRPHPAEGVALVNLYGIRLSAGEVLWYAERSQQGFRLREDAK